MSQKIYSNLEIKGNVTVSNITNATLDTDKFLVSDGGLLKYRTGAEILFDIGVTSGYVPYTGAISNLDLGEYQLSTGQITFDQTPTQTAGVGVLRWNDADGTLDLGLKGGNVTLQLGQEQLVRVVNKTVSNLTEAGYQVVYTSGAQGQRLKVDLALANSDLTSAGTLGIVTENIAVNQEGFVTTNGLVRGINTTGSLQSETWVDGDILYLSPTTAGMLTNIKPIAPNHTVTVGVCVHAHATQGSIFVKVDNGYELEELHNILISTPLNNQVLSYETSSGLWKNKSITSLGGISGTGTLNYLPKFTGASTIGNSQIIDNGTNVLVGTTTDTGQKLQILGVTKITESQSFVPQTLILKNGSTAANIGSSIYFDGYYKQALISTLASPGSTTGADLKLQTYSSDTVINEGITVKRQGRVLVNTSVDDGSSAFQVSGVTAIRGLSTSDGGQLGSELTTTGTGTNWTGTDFATGYTHLIGSTASLTTTLAAVNNTFYQITYTISGRTAGSITINYGGVAVSGIIATGASAPITSSTATLNIVPTTDFDGTLILSVKSIGQSTAVMLLKNSSGTTTTEFRISNNSSNLFIGNASGRRITTGGSNTGLGEFALRDVTSASNNTALGNYSLASVTTGNGNVSVGASTLPNNRTGSNNIGLGTIALYFNTTGSSNVGIGTQALYGNTTGSNNVAIGTYSLNAASAVIGNVALGHNTLFSATSGNYNLVMGYEAGRYISDKTTGVTTLNNSILLGYRASTLGNSQTNQIVIGHDATGLGSNTTVLGNSSTTQTWLGGRVTIGTTTDDGINHIQVTGSIKSTSSVQVGDSAVAASSSNVGAIRYRSDANNSYMDMVMQTGASTYEWVNIVQHNW